MLGATICVQSIHEIWMNYENLVFIVFIDWTWLIQQKNLLNISFFAWVNTIIEIMVIINDNYCSDKLTQTNVSLGSAWKCKRTRSQLLVSLYLYSSCNLTKVQNLSLSVFSKICIKITLTFLFIIFPMCNDLAWVHYVHFGAVFKMY